MNPQENKWVDSSPTPQDLRGRLPDDIHHVTLAIHDPLWRFILKHWYQQFEGRIIHNGIRVGIIGKDALPIGIELTQWNYSVHFVEDEEWKITAAKKDAKVQAGMFDDYVACDYFSDLPRCAVYAFVGILHRPEFYDKRNVKRWIDLLLRRCKQIVCALRYDEKLLKYLEEEYNAHIVPYPDWRYMFVVIS